MTSLDNSVNTISTEVTLNSAATAIAVSNASTGLLTVGAITGSATSGTQTVNVGSSGTGGITLNSVISDGSGGGAVALTVNNTGTGVTTIGDPSFTTTDTFTGGVTLSGGTLSLGTGTPLGTGTFTLAGGAINPLNTATFLNLTNNLNVTAATTTDIINGGTRDVVYTGTVSGSGTIQVNSSVSRSLWLLGDGSGFTGTINYTNSPMQDNEVWQSCSSPNVYSSMKCALDDRFESTSLNDSTNELNFGSPHTGICQFVFCDGAVRAMNIEITLQTHKSLANCKDGLAVDANVY